MYFFMHRSDNKVISSELAEYELESQQDTGFLGTSSSKLTDYRLINSYSEYLEAVNKADSWSADNPALEERAEKVKQALNGGKYDREYFEDYSLLLVEDLIFRSAVYDSTLNDVCIRKKELNVNLTVIADGNVSGGQAELFFITLLKKDIENINKINIVFNPLKNSRRGVAYKPIIYLYPTEETEVNVILKNADKLTCSYPTYNSGWRVTAKPNGDLKELNTNKNLYALYYESENTYGYKTENDGFVIKGEDSARFLEEKLKILGLTDREAEEFIIYWLPKLEANKYNYVRFATEGEINANMPLEISPKPDTLIRVLMTFKGLERPVCVKEQELSTPNRTGFVAVEWGGTEIEK